MSVQQRIPCPCGDWEWREVTLQTGLAALERFCPRCKSRVLLVFRGPVLMAAVKFGGSHERRLEQALREAGMHEHETQVLLTVARLMAAS